MEHVGEQICDIGDEIADGLAERGKSNEFPPDVAVAALSYAILKITWTQCDAGKEAEALRAVSRKFADMVESFAGRVATLTAPPSSGGLN